MTALERENQVAASQLMKGAPPSAQAQVTLANWRQPPYNRWSFAHVPEIVPSAWIRTDHHQEPVVGDPTLDTDGLVVDFHGRRCDFDAWRDETYTDGLLVIHDDEIVYEWYGQYLQPGVQHLIMSVSKSVLGVVAGVLQDRGVIRPDQRVDALVPEVKDSAFGGATLQDLLDMRCAVDFDENYLTTSGAMGRYRKAQQWDPSSPGEDSGDLRAFFPTLTGRTGPHGGRFHYMSPTPDLLGWAIERATGERYADLVAELLWKPLGACADATITVDRLGAPRCAGGMCMVLRDLGRLGQMVANGGLGARGRVVSRAWVDDVVNHGDARAWRDGDFYELYERADLHYRNYWYVLRGENPLVFGSGAFGQNVFVDVNRRIVVAKFSSQPLALDQTALNITTAGVLALMDRIQKRPGR